ncbi:MAG: leucine-rich repeat domain-containing protein [Clostridiales bacterium]|jgi:hypothetical protein|nr:leucine-rich repeat domain-containing protein [Clostridiales bacterium]
MNENMAAPGGARSEDAAAAEETVTADGAVFSKDRTALLNYPSIKADPEYAIPDGVASIGNRAFSGCESLASVSMPGSVAKKRDENWQKRV